LQLLSLFGVNQLDVLVALLEAAESDSPQTVDFFARFDDSSVREWFDSEDDIRSYFDDERHFEQLVNLEFEKLNIQYAVVLLEEYKEAFDTLMLAVCRRLG